MVRIAATATGAAAQITGTFPTKIISFTKPIISIT